jgi:hypothetical protein
MKPRIDRPLAIPMRGFIGCETGGTLSFGH